MAKGEKPVMPPTESGEKKQRECFDSEDLECRSQRLSLALMHKKALKKWGDKNEGKGKQGEVAGAVKLSSEFLASVIVGAVLGLGFDKLAGSLPWGLVFFLFLGFAAGILSILRSVGYVAPSKLGKGRTSRQDKEAKKRSNK
ncbi:AtpZ/AtpI family protein [Bartonella raoultii]|uniref:ATP synthase protein I n=1 Tax=Bartonella raoultii TaxID=1457020 RepID=A0ABS7I929_9HYPH|nr:AtpZ/AtpI family protein [Bartonella raoultii]MBX4336162.1 AtpZ/AtpI family protein [Bartonella raoultii]